MKLTVIRTFMAALTIGLGLLSAPIAASADDNPSAVIEQIRASGVLKVPVMTGEEPGYIKDPATGQWSGFYYEFLGEIATQLGVKLEPVETTWGNLAADFQSNKIDIAIGVNPNPKRGLVVDYLWEPLFTDAWAVLTPPGKPVKTWAELNSPDKTVVVQKGSTMQVVAEALLPKAKITPVEDRGLALMELQAGRADGVVFSIFDALQITNQKIGDVVASRADPAQSGNACRGAQARQCRLHQLPDQLDPAGAFARPRPGQACPLMGSPWHRSVDPSGRLQLLIANSLTAAQRGGQATTGRASNQ